MVSRGAVTGNTAVTVPELAAFVAVAPDTVKPLAATPVNVHPALAVSAIVAVYTVLAAKVLALGDQEMVPVYWVESIAVVNGTASFTGATTPGMASDVIA
jgi:hypothetical protein